MRVVGFLCRTRGQNQCSLYYFILLILFTINLLLSICHFCISEIRVGLVVFFALSLSRWALFIWSFWRRIFPVSFSLLSEFTPMYVRTEVLASLLASNRVLCSASRGFLHSQACDFLIFKARDVRLSSSHGSQLSDFYPCLVSLAGDNSLLLRTHVQDWAHPNNS